jgi:putative peptidoglycan lipid II flippase
VIGALTLVSRVLGYVRDQRIAYLLGTSIVGDSYVLAYRIPNLLRRLVAEGSMTASFVPVFAPYLLDKERLDWKEFANRMFWTLTVILAAIAALGVVLSPLLIKLLTAAGGGRLDVRLAVLLNRIMWPFILFIGLSALATAILNSFRSFAVPAFAPVVFNICIIGLSFAAFRFRQPSLALAIGVTLGGLVQFALQLPSLWKRGMHFQFGISFKHPGIRRVGRLMGPGVIGIGVAQINFVVDTMFATHRLMPNGSLMSLQIADRVMELVLGGYAIAIATAILPLMSQQVAERNIFELRQTVSFSLRLVTFITIPAMVGLVLLREPIIEVLFQHGRFNQQSTALTAWALLFSALGLPWFAATKIIVPAFYSTHDTRTPVKVALGVMFANIAFNLLFLKPLRNGGPAAATALAALLNFGVLFWIFRRRHGLLGGRAILGSVAKVAAASAVMGLACWVMLRMSGFPDPAGIVHHAVALRVAALAGMLLLAAGLFFAVAWLLNCEELHEMYGIARRKQKAGIRC